MAFTSKKIPLLMAELKKDAKYVHFTYDAGINQLIFFIKNTPFFYSHMVTITEKEPNKYVIVMEMDSVLRRKDMPVRVACLQLVMTALDTPFHIHPLDKKLYLSYGLYDSSDLNEFDAFKYILADCEKAISLYPYYK